MNDKDGLFPLKKPRQAVPLPKFLQPLDQKGGFRMSDQCKYCSCYQDIDRCRSVDCSIKDSWYARELDAEIDIRLSERDELEAENASLRRGNELLQSLKEYACHVDGCAPHGCGHHCTCGLTELLESLEKEAENG